jgi:hypothetical protein
LLLTSNFAEFLNLPCLASSPPHGLLHSLGSRAFVI